MSKPVYLSESDFTVTDSQAGSESIVATAKVPSTQVWQVPVGMPIVAALTVEHTTTVAAGASETVELDPVAPKVDYMADPENGYSAEAYIVGYYDNGNGDTQMSDATGVAFTSFTSTDDFVTAVDLENTTGSDADVSIYTVARHGYAKIQKRNSGKQNVTQELQTEDAITLAFSNPDDPQSDRQVAWDASNQGLSGVFPPKFNLDIVYYDATETVAVEAANATNLQLSIPVNQRALNSDENAADLRRRVSLNMAGN